MDWLLRRPGNRKERKEKKQEGRKRKDRKKRKERLFGTDADQLEAAAAAGGTRGLARDASTVYWKLLGRCESLMYMHC